MPRAVELARLAERVQLLGRAFDAAAFFTDQVQLTTGQARGEGVEDVIGQVLDLGRNTTAVSNSRSGAFTPNWLRSAKRASNAA